MALFAWRTVQVAAITSGGPDQDLTISGIGTPVAMIIEATRVTTAGTGVDHGILSIGITDGVDQFAACVRHEDAQTTLDTGRMLWSAGVVLIENPGADTVDGQAEFKEWITDGARITWLDFPAGAYILNVTFIYGTLAQAKVFNFVTDGVEDQVDLITGAGFDPNVALFWHWRQVFADPANATNDAVLRHGFAVDNEGTIEQLTMGMFDDDARSTAHGWGFGFREDCVLQDVLVNAAGTATFGTRLEVVSFVTGSGGVQVKTVAGTGVVISFNGIALLLKTGKNRVTAKGQDVDSATSGSSGSAKKITASSASGTWKPKLARAIGTNLSVP